MGQREWSGGLLGPIEVRVLSYTYQAWNRGLELNMRATDTSHSFRSVSTRRHQYSSGR